MERSARGSGALIVGPAREGVLLLKNLQKGEVLVEGNGKGGVCTPPVEVPAKEGYTSGNA